MKKLLFILAAGLMAGGATAQKLPQPSPSAKVDQTVGLTELSIAYSRPSVKGRTIFGDLLAYDAIWRLGANACTKLTTSTAINIAGVDVQPGTYALFATPMENGTWKFMVNTDTEQWGAGDYDAAKNLVATDVKTMAAPFTETFTIAFTDLTNTSGNITVMWEKTMFSVPFTVATEKIAEDNIQMAIKKGEDLQDVYYSAASYYSKSLMDNKKALMSIEKGLKVKETHRLYFLRAQIFYKQGEKEAAMKAAKRAHELAIKAESKGWADYIKETMEGWEKK